MENTMSESQLETLCAACGWQGGTYWQVVDEIRRLRSRDAYAGVLRAALEKLNDKLRLVWIREWTQGGNCCGNLGCNHCGAGWDGVHDEHHSPECIVGIARAALASDPAQGAGNLDRQSVDQAPRAPSTERRAAVEDRDDPYFVQVSENGCRHCGSGRMWTIITPNGAEYGQAWHADDGECPTDAEETCANLNAAYWHGHADGKRDAVGTGIKEMVDRFLAWQLPKDFSPDAGITFTPSPHPHGWPTGTNLFTAAQAKAMLWHLLDIDGTERDDAPSPSPRTTPEAHEIFREIWANTRYQDGLAFEEICTLALKGMELDGAPAGVLTEGRETCVWERSPHDPRSLRPKCFPGRVMIPDGDPLETCHHCGKAIEVREPSNERHGGEK
jgi:hypothetical protein